MTKYYGVESRVYNDGHIVANIITFEGREKPMDESIEAEAFDGYKDWFDSKVEAQAWLLGCMNA